MAHKGRDYKVAFRRDLNTVDYNFRGWPEMWLGVAGPFDGVLAVEFSFQEFRCLFRKNESIASLIWRSELKLFVTRQYAMQIEITITNGPRLPNYPLRVQIFDVGGNPVVDATGSTPSDTNVQCGDNIPVADVETARFYGVSGAHLDVFGDAAGYDIYNP